MVNGCSDISTALTTGIDTRYLLWNLRTQKVRHHVTSFIHLTNSHKVEKRFAAHSNWLSGLDSALGAGAYRSYPFILIHHWINLFIICICIWQRSGYLRIIKNGSLQMLSGLCNALQSDHSPDVYSWSSSFGNGHRLTWNGQGKFIVFLYATSYDLGGGALSNNESFVVYVMCRWYIHMFTEARWFRPSNIWSVYMVGLRIRFRMVRVFAIFRWNWVWLGMASRMGSGIFRWVSVY